MYLSDVGAWFCALCAACLGLGDSILRPDALRHTLFRTTTLDFSTLSLTGLILSPDTVTPSKPHFTLEPEKVPNQQSLMHIAQVRHEKH